MWAGVPPGTLLGHKFRNIKSHDVIDDEMIISPGVVIQPSKLNPEHDFSPRLRDEMRLVSPSPVHNYIPSPITQKRKRNVI